MSFLTRIPIKRRLFVITTIAAVGFLALSGLFFRTVETVKVNGPMYGEIVLGKDLVADILPPPEYLLEANLAAHELVSAVVHNAPQLELDEQIERLARLATEFETRHVYWEENLPEGALRTAMLEESYVPAQEFLSIVERELVPAAREGDTQKVDDLLEGSLSQAYAAHRAGIDHAVELTNARNTEVEQRAAEELASQMWISGVMALIILAIVGWVAWQISTSIVRPLDRLVARMRELAQGQGDLTTRMDTEGRDEVAQLSQSFNEFVGKLQQMVAQVKETAGDTAVAAKELAATASNIASSSQEQASSLEETAASLEEITGTVKQNAENAAQANKLASTSHKVAEKGGSVVASTVGAIGEINEASGRIADIITTIDEIAFQTNLLALNAAVEAARAGEHGRGFAVVAAEVRTLAQRSAQAAKEIRGLIQDSASKVATGTKLASNSGDTLREIVDSVKKVTDLVAEITAASREQSIGVEQVNRAVVSMDQVVQSNAAQTEELSATAQMLSDRADTILDLMSGFRVDHGEPSRAPTTHHAAPPAAPALPVAAAKKPSASTRPAAKPAASRAAPVSSTVVSGKDDDEGFIEF
ncbi:MAG: HAMP domain-containing protein [Planctomycetes bacterium]|nr:HAMP domain-containing protein [Planctomycetota bacterium]